jgi:hypothetical protein
LNVLRERKRKWQEAGEGCTVKNCYVYISPNDVRVIKSRRLRCVGHVAHMGELKNLYKILVRKPEGKKLLGRPRCRW